MSFLSPSDAVLPGSSLVPGIVDSVTGVTKPNTGMSPEQTAILETQRQALDAQRAALTKQLGNINLLQPGVLDALGFGTGGVGGALKDKLLAAIRGEGVSDPALEQSLQQQELELRNKLSQQIGPGYETSSPGIEALNRFKTMAAGARFQSRQGITQNYGNLLNSDMSSLFQGTQLANPTIAGMGTNAAGYSGPLSDIFKQEQLGVNSQLAQEKNRTTLLSSILGTNPGDVAGAGATKAIMG